MDTNGKIPRTFLGSFAPLSQANPSGLDLSNNAPRDGRDVPANGLQRHDLDAGLPDLGGPFDVVTCLHFHTPGLYPALRALLAPGGFLVVETLTSENVELNLPRPSEQYLAEPGEVLRHAAGLRIRLYREALVDGSVRAQLLAQEPSGLPPDLKR